MPLWVPPIVTMQLCQGRNFNLLFHRGIQSLSLIGFLKFKSLREMKTLQQQSTSARDSWMSYNRNLRNWFVMKVFYFSCYFVFRPFKPPGCTNEQRVAAALYVAKTRKYIPMLTKWALTKIICLYMYLIRRSLAGFDACSFWYSFSFCAELSTMLPYNKCNMAIGLLSVSNIWCDILYPYHCYLSRNFLLNFNCWLLHKFVILAKCLALGSH
jgi:hypothetical protein